MDPSVWTLTTLGVGILTVVGSILALRLHAFLALLIGALVVAWMAPTERVGEFELRKSAVAVLKVIDAESMTVETGFVVGERFSLLRRSDLEEVARFELSREEGGVGVLTAIEGDTQNAMDNSTWLVPLGAKRKAEGAAKRSAMDRVARGFGDTCAKVGILIALAALIGKCLLESGAADRIVRSLLSVFGEKRAPASFVASSFLLGIPVFFDTVFYLMVPLAKALRLRTEKNYLFYVLAIVAGGTMAHSLVPPTPGPLFVAEELGVDMGTMIIAGCCVGCVTVLVGYIFAAWANSRHELPLRESPDVSLAEIEALAKRDLSELPSFWMSCLPILLPVVLIGGATLLRSAEAEGLSFLLPLGNKNVALLISAAIALYTLVRQRKLSGGGLRDATQAALSSGGTIILITAAGGAFGAVLKQTGVASLVETLPRGYPLLILVFAWGLTTAVRTAQGSATVAMITAVGVISGIAAQGGLGYHPVYIALAIGCGSKPFAWMNDSGFWVIGRMSGMTEAETLRFVTPMTAIMGIVGLLVTLLGAAVLPLV